MRRLLLVGLLAACGCAELKQIAAAAFQKPTVELRSASLQSLDLEGATVAFDWRVANPNGFGLHLARLSYALEVEGKRAVDGELKNGIEIPASGSADVRLPVHVRFADVAGFARLVAARDRLAYRLSGSAGVSTPVGVVDLPLAHEGTIETPRLPTLSIEAVEVRSVSLADLSLDVRVGIHNPNAFPLPGGSVSYALSLAGSRVATGEGQSLAAVKPNGRGTLAIPVRVSFANAGRVASQLAAGGAIDVSLQGTAVIAGVPVPIDLQGKVPAFR